MSHVARVGVILVIGLALLGGIYFLLSGRYARMHSYPITVIFDNALGLQVGARVRVAGVDVGTVGAIDLNQADFRARMRLDIGKEFAIPEGSTFTIATGALIGEKYIDITPAKNSRTMAPNTVVDNPKQVQAPFQFEAVGSDFQKLIADFRQLSQNLNAVVGNPALRRGMADTVTNLARTTARAEQLMLGMQGVLAANQGRVDQTMTNLAGASNELRGAMEDVRAVVSQAELRTDVAATADQLRTASERLDAVLQDVREVTGDPQVAQNLKETARNMSEATGYARDVTERISRVFSGGGGGPRIVINVPKPHFESGTRVALESAGTGSGNVRTDLQLTFPTGKDSGLRLGLYDFTEHNRVIAQRLHWLDPRTAVRYGLFAGHVGAGMDYDASQKLNWSADLYDPKYPRLDIRGRYYYSNEFGVVFGVDGILRQPKAVIGIQWRH